MSIQVALLDTPVTTWMMHSRAIERSARKIGRESSALPQSPATPVAFFAHERGDARVRKRIAALLDCGRMVIGFTFHRVRDKADKPPSWENIHLGTTYNRCYLQRLLAHANAIQVLWKHRRKLATCGVIYAVNTDNAVLALLGSFLAGGRPRLILELADIQPIMIEDGVVSRFLRAIERAVLRQCSILVTTSPGYIRNYFEPVQHYKGRIFLLENKVYPSNSLPCQRVRRDPAEGGRPWIVGYFSAFQCRASLLRIRYLAQRLGGRIRFLLRGYPGGTIAGEFAKLLGDPLPNLIFAGPYEYPADLGEMYAGVDFNWAFDEGNPSGNSSWCLPNRIYEGGCFGVPALADARTETGRWVESRGLGWTFDDPLDENLALFFESLSFEEWQRVRLRCIAHPREDFAGEADYARLALELGSNP